MSTADLLRKPWQITERINCQDNHKKPAKAGVACQCPTEDI